MTEEPPEKQNKTIINIIMLIIVVVWAVSILFDAFDKNYSSPPGVNAALMIVVAFLFNAKGVKTNENGTNGNDSEVKK